MPGDRLDPIRFLKLYQRTRESTTCAVCDRGSAGRISAMTDTRLAPDSPVVARIIAWARTHARRKRRRRLLAGALLLSCTGLAAAALLSSWSTVTLILVGAGVAIGMSAAASGVAHFLPLKQESAIWLADRAFGLNDRLVTALDPTAGHAPMAAVLQGEIEGLLAGEERASPQPVRSGLVAGGLRRRLRRWRTHLLVLIALVAILVGHGLLSPLTAPAETLAGDLGKPRSLGPGAGRAVLRLALEKGRGAKFPRGTPIQCSLDLSGGSVEVHGVEVRHLTRDGQVLAVESLALQITPDGHTRFDLQPLLAKAGLDGPGRRIVEVRGLTDEGGSLITNPVAPLIVDQKGSGSGKGSGGGKKPKPKPKNKQPKKQNKKKNAKPKPKGGKPPPEGPPKHIPIRVDNRFVMPLLDEKGRMVNKKRWTLRFTPDKRAPEKGKDDRTAPPSFKDLVEEYRRRAESVMDRRGVPDEDRALFLRYLELLERT